MNRQQKKQTLISWLIFLSGLPLPSTDAEMSSNDLNQTIIVQIQQCFSAIIKRVKITLYWSHAYVKIKSREVADSILVSVKNGRTLLYKNPVR